MTETTYIYVGITKDGEVISLPTERGTLNELARRGGGTYTNKLHKFKLTVKASEVGRY